MRSPKVAGLRRSGVVVAERIAESIYRAGGEPLSLFGGDESEADGRFGAFDGAVLPGGRDVDPRLYTDEPRHPRTDEPDEIQDAADIAAAGAVISDGAADAGDLPRISGTQRRARRHAGATPGTGPDRPRQQRTVRGRLAARLACRAGHGVDRCCGVVTTTRPSRASARTWWSWAGRATDVEAFEHVTAPVMGVQWHPEDNAQGGPRTTGAVRLRG